jgi:NADPH2:quinone reductase
VKVVIDELAESPDQAIEHHVRLEEMERPDPATLASSEVLIEVRSASVGWVDLIMASGQYQHVPEPPYTPGLELAGVVSWAGAEAAGVTVGQRVLVDPFLSGPRSHGEHRRWGGWASWAAAPAAAVRPIPGALDFDQACNLLGNYETAYHGLVARGRLARGESVLILGASGSTGLAAVQLARILGARVIAVGRDRAKLAVVAEHGAEHVVCTADGPLRDQVKALTGGRGVDVVWDGVGGDLSLEALRCVAFGARYLIIGWAATPLVARGKGGRGAPNANHQPTNLIMMKGLDVLGCPTVISTVQDRSIRAPRIAQVLAWAESGDIRPHVSHVFPLARIQDAMRAKWRGEVVGGCVVHP